MGERTVRRTLRELTLSTVPGLVVAVVGVVATLVATQIGASSTREAVRQETAFQERVTLRQDRLETLLDFLELVEQPILRPRGIFCPAPPSNPSGIVQDRPCAPKDQAVWDEFVEYDRSVRRALAAVRVFHSEATYKAAESIVSVIRSPRKVDDPWDYIRDRTEELIATVRSEAQFE